MRWHDIRTWAGRHSRTLKALIAGLMIGASVPPLIAPIAADLLVDSVAIEGEA